ncbi:hypothetical protein EZS27_014942 [termite gut metagenome]|uniref:Uncharacterized protein n=1 Tax=termite gut metagenome TaxID=433724 RepID=A0A5J4RVC6_9ZZZZ
MKNLIILAIIEKLNHSNPDTDNCIILKSNEIQLADDFSFFELYSLYIELLTEGYELILMEKDSIKVRKAQKTIYFE